MARKTAEPPATVDPVDALPAVTISGGVSAVVSEAVESYRWANRMSRADVVKEALTEWCDARELLEDAHARLAQQIEDAAVAVE